MRSYSMSEYGAYQAGRFLGYLVGGWNKITHNATPDRSLLVPSQSHAVIAGAEPIAARLAASTRLADRLERYKPAMVRIIPLQDGLGSINISMYEGERRVERRLYINDPKLKAKLAFQRFDFPSWSLQNEEESWSTNYIVLKTMQDVEQMLNQRLAESGSTPAPVKPMSVSPGSQKIAAAASPTAERPSADHAQPSETVVVRETRASGNQKKVTHVGRYVGSGVAPRSKKNYKTKKLESFDQFFLVFEDAALDFGQNTVWGADLERALEVAHVKPGDSIQIINHGRTPIQLASGENGDSAYKISYEVKKL